MAHILKSDAAAGYPVYSYAGLAALRRDADAGDPVAHIRLAELPPAERRLAAMVADVNKDDGKHDFDGFCLECGTGLDKADKKCRRCGHVNPFHVPGVKKGRAGKMKRKKARRVMLGKAAGYGYRPAPVSRKAALRAMLAADLASPDPRLRETARRALAEL